MSLGTLGAILKYAINLENTAIIFYEKAKTGTSNQELIDVFEISIKQNQKNIKKLKRTRREHTIEMILEPIKGLEKAQFIIKTQSSEGSDDKLLLGLARTMEKKIEEYYIAVAEKIGFLAEVSYTFQQLAEKHAENLSIL